MCVSITLPNDLQEFLQSHAQRVGIPFETLLARTIVERWDSVRLVPPLEDRESDLRLRLQTLFPTEQTHEYQDLCRQSDAGTLSEPARQRFLSLLEQRDHQNAERLEIVAELAALRSVSFREMMQQLGIRPE